MPTASPLESRSRLVAALQNLRGRARLRPLLLRPREGRTAALLTLPQEGHRGHVGPVPPKPGAAVTLQGLLGSHAIQNTGAAA